MFQMLKRMYDQLVNAIHQAEDIASYFQHDGEYRAEDIDAVILLRDVLRLFVEKNREVLTNAGII